MREALFILIVGLIGLGAYDYFSGGKLGLHLPASAVRLLESWNIDPPDFLTGPSDYGKGLGEAWGSVPKLP